MYAYAPLSSVHVRVRLSARATRLCGAVQCKDPWNTMFYSESCRRTSSCASNERKSQVCTSRPWYAPWKCNSYADQCCSRTLTDSFPAYKASSCKKSYDFCIKPKSSIWDIVGAAFTGQLDVAWCSTKCKASELRIATKVEWLKVKNLALEAINAISKGAQKVWSAIGKYVGMIFSLNNITAYGKLATSGQELTFLIDMKILGIPVRPVALPAAPGLRDSLSGLSVLR